MDLDLSFRRLQHDCHNPGKDKMREERETGEEKRSKMKDFFKGRLRKSSDTRSCSLLASESSVSSMASDNLGPPPSLGLLSDPPSSPIYTSKVRVDPHCGETDLAKKGKVKITYKMIFVPLVFVY